MAVFKKQNLREPLVPLFKGGSYLREFGSAGYTIFFRPIVLRFLGHGLRRAASFLCRFAPMPVPVHGAKLPICGPELPRTTQLPKLPSEPRPRLRQQLLASAKLPELNAQLASQTLPQLAIAGNFG